jgi:hypothetical protein
MLGAIYIAEPEPEPAAGGSPEPAAGGVSAAGGGDAGAAFLPPHAPASSAEARIAQTNDVFFMI